MRDRKYLFPIEPDLDLAHNGENFWAIPIEKQNLNHRKTRL